jgi:aminoglycoside phosphotransferase family enzyme
MRDDRIALTEKVAALCRPETYPEAPTRIEMIETHMSYVFLTPRHAYKFKKPVSYAFLDFSTLQLRQRDCEEELRLNQRLAPGVYLGVVPLARDANGRLRIGADGVPAEWLVQMQRLPRERMLDERIRQGTLEERELVALASRLACFYRSCARAPVTAVEYRSRIGMEIETDRAALAARAQELGNQEITATITTLLEFVDKRHALLDERVAAGRIVEGHGDLRPEHVCLLEEPVVFDSLEFNRDLRLVDPADELALLALECERLGAAQVGTILFECYSAHAADTPPPALIDFYKARRASLRARLAILHLDEIRGPLGARWVALCRRYLALAQGYARRLNALSTGVD